MERSRVQDQAQIDKESQELAEVGRFGLNLESPGDRLYHIEDKLYALSLMLPSLEGSTKGLEGAAFMLRTMSEEVNELAYEVFHGKRLVGFTVGERGDK